MSTTNKVLLTIFSILIIFAVVEVGYFFIYKPMTQQKITPTTEKKSTSTPNFDNVPAKKELLEIYQSLKAEAKAAAKSALNRETVQAVNNLSKELVISSRLSLNLNGTIKEINITGGSVKQANKETKFLVKIVLAKNKSSHSLYFIHKEDLAKVTVFKFADGKETSINMSELKIGDKINVFLQLDATKDPVNNLIQAKIVKT